MTNNNLQYKENPKIKWIILSTGLIILIILTILFRVTNWDLEISGSFYNGEWFAKDEQPWLFFYEYDTYLMMITLIPCIVLIIMGLLNKEKKILTTYGIFILLAALITAGLLVNAIFKGYWGRPRPRDTIPLGGEDPFYFVWDPAFLDGMTGKSFPSGHPTGLLVAIGVFFVFNHPEFIVRYFGEFKEWKLKLCKFIKYGYLAISFFGGILMGMGRIIQGGHFASDVLWSFFFVYVPTFLMYYYVFKIPKKEKEILESKTS